MAETFSGRYNQDFFEQFMKLIKSIYPEFDSSTFLNFIYNDEWEGKQFKERMRHISNALRATLPDSYREALEILQQAAPQCRGVEYLFFPDFVEAHGLADWTASTAALEAFTPYSSSEFAVRPFILQDSEKMMKQMLEWATHQDHHVRRLASEGCRPRLPWAMALEQFKTDPAPILPILEQLKRDTSVYVQKSVANNLNDIAKDHPQLVIKLAHDWYGENRHTNWILKHGCRGLLRKGEPQVLALFGFELAPDAAISSFNLTDDRITLGQTLHFSFSITSKAVAAQRLRVEYAIDFVKANGTTSRKLFKIAELNMEQAVKTYERAHPFKDLTTRKHYPGKHRISIVINGVEMAGQEFEVVAGEMED